MLKDLRSIQIEFEVSDLGALVEDSDFLNALQTGVNRWIKEIQKVRFWDRTWNDIRNLVSKRIRTSWDQIMVKDHVEPAFVPNRPS